MSLPKHRKVLYSAMNRFSALALVVAALALQGCNNANAVSDPEKSQTTPVRDIKKTVRKEGAGNPILEGDVVYLEYVIKSATEEFVFDRNDEVKDETGPTLPPYFFGLGSKDAIAGLYEAVTNAKVGDEFEVFIPWEKAYGEKGLSELNIPGKQDLVFSVKVLNVARAGEEYVYDTVDTVVGSGAEVKNGDRVTIHYRGTYVNGKRFDNSRERGDIKAGGTPLRFKVGAGKVIQGIDAGIVGMKVGGKRRLTLPPLLVFGQGGYGAVMGGQIAVFEIEVLKID